jgi:hypothetical protein
LRRAEVAPGTDLIVSIDGGGPNHHAVRAVADSIEWTAGAKRVIAHERLGLVEHHLRCGDLTADLGAVVMLEDDLVVGPGFVGWARAALAAASADDRIAGVSLAAPWFDGYRHLRFEPVDDGSDGIYLQVPWYDGMAWTAPMWNRFRSRRPDPSVPVHRFLDTLEDEWFPMATRYLVDTGRWYLLPRTAHATNTGATGAHFDTATDWFQVPISFRARPDHHILGLDDALAVYDDHMELTAAALGRLVPDLAADLDGKPVTVDLLGVRDLDHTTAPLVLTTRPVTASIRSWGASMHPLVANLAYGVAGDAIHLAAREHVGRDRRADAVSLATLRAHHAHGRDLAGRDALRAVGRRVARRIRRG